MIQKIYGKYKREKNCGGRITNPNLCTRLQQALKLKFAPHVSLLLIY